MELHVQTPLYKWVGQYGETLIIIAVAQYTDTPLPNTDFTERESYSLFNFFLFLLISLNLLVCLNIFITIIPPFFS